MAFFLPKGFVICDVTRINITKEVLLFTPNQTYIEGGKYRQSRGAGLKCCLAHTRHITTTFVIIF